MLRILKTHPELKPFESDLELRMDRERGPLLLLGGADLVDGTPVYDIKPYVPYADSHPEAAGGFADRVDWHPLEVDFPLEHLALVPEEKRAALLGVLGMDPRPAYQEDPDRVYGFTFAGLNLRFSVAEGQLRVLAAEPISEQNNE